MFIPNGLQGDAWDLSLRQTIVGPTGSSIWKELHHASGQ